MNRDELKKATCLHSKKNALNQELPTSDFDENQ